MVNETDFTGRKKRTWWFGPSSTTLTDAAAGDFLTPSMRSRPGGRWHTYYRVSDAKLEEFEAKQKGLVAKSAATARSRTCRA